MMLGQPVHGDDSRWRFGQASLEPSLVARFMPALHMEIAPSLLHAPSIRLLLERRQRVVLA